MRTQEFANEKQKPDQILAAVCLKGRALCSFQLPYNAWNAGISLVNGAAAGSPPLCQRLDSLTEISWKDVDSGSQNWQVEWVLSVDCVDVAGQEKTGTFPVAQTQTDVFKGTWRLKTAEVQVWLTLTRISGKLCILR